MQTDANMQKLTHTQLSMHAQPFTWLQNRSQWFLRIKPIDMSCSKNENSAKLTTAEIKTNQTRFHKSKFCPVRNRPKLWNSQNWQWACKQKLPRHLKTTNPSSLSSTALCTAFCAFSATADRPCQSLALQPSSQVYQKSHPWQSMIHAPFKQFSWLPIQTCTRGCRSRRIPKPS